MKSFGVTGIRRPPLTPINSPVFLDTPKKNRCSQYSHFKKETLKALHSLPEVDFYDFGLSRGEIDIMPFLWNGFDAHIGYTYVIPATEKDAWRKNISEKTRRALKSAHAEAAETGSTIEANPGSKKSRRSLRRRPRQRDFRWSPMHTLQHGGPQSRRRRRPDVHCKGRKRQGSLRIAYGMGQQNNLLPD